MSLLANDLVLLVETPKENVAAALKLLGGVEGVASKLNVTLEHGLDGHNDSDLSQREEKYGKNFVEPEPPSTIFELMWQAFQDFTLLVLTGAGVLSFILGFVNPSHTDEGGVNSDWIEGAAIMAVVLLVVFVTAISDYQKEKQFRALNAVKEDEKIKVIRNSAPAEVSKFKLVVGDVVRVEVGDIIPADGLVFDENDLKLDESAMTGESLLLKKHRENAPFLISGTKVMEGVGKMLVICVGEHAQAGIISKLIMGKKAAAASTAAVHQSSTTANDKENLNVVVEAPYMTLETPKTSIVDAPHPSVEEESVSPLQGKLDRLTLLIGKIGFYTALIVFLAMVIRFSIQKFVKDDAPWSNTYFNTYLEFFIIGVTVLVVAIPEGLPLAVTIALAYSVKKMLKDQNLVRHLDACETMGSATTICSDKTGTLTTNRMTVVQCYLGDQEFSTAVALQQAMAASTADLLSLSIALNSTAEILPPIQAGGLPEHTGNKTECALLQLATEMGMGYANIRKQHPIGHMITFSSAKKRMSVVVPLSASTCRVFTKGASEIVLGLCTSWHHLDGSVDGATWRAYVRNKAEEVIEKYASQAYRTLCLAYRDIAEPIEVVKTWSDEDIEKDLTCLAIVGIEDPVRPEVPGSIRQCKEAGIVVRMVTGDNLATAKSIALKCGIIAPNDGSLVMEGVAFRNQVLDSHGNIKQDEFDKIWPMLRVLARSSPKDKYTLVSGLLKSNLKPHGPQVVAVTGDGTNDAPALKKADVGFAMGICGTAVAKDASDIILMDDNFTSIVSAVKWGRNVYDSVAKFLQFQLTVNLVAITVAVVGAVFLEESPLTAVQLLWVNIIMDTFASLALATDSPTPAMLKRKPYSRTKPLLSKKMTKHIVGQSLLQLIVLLILVFSGDTILGVQSGRKLDGWSGPSEHYTIVFNVFVFMQLFNEVNCRRIHDEWNVFEGILSNPLYVGITILQLALHLLIVEVGGRVFSCTPLNAWQWGLSVGLGFISLPFGFLLRLIHSHHLPKKMAICQEPLHVHERTERGQELWTRGFKRLRTQIRVINAFKKSVANAQRSIVNLE